MVLLPVPARDGAVHARALGEDRVQLSAGFRGSDGRLHRLRLHATAHHGHTALLRGRPMTRSHSTPDSAHSCLSVNCPRPMRRRRGRDTLTADVVLMLD